MTTLSLLESQTSGGPWSLPASALDFAELDAAVADAIRSLNEYNAWRFSKGLPASGGHVLTFQFLAANGNTSQFRALVLAWVVNMHLSDPPN